MDIGPHDDTRGDIKKNQASPSTYESIVDAVQDGVFVVNLDGIITYANDSLCSLTGQERNELVGEAFHTLDESGLIQSEEFDRLVTAIDDLAHGKYRSKVSHCSVGKDPNMW
jgi:PAS domain S-box-containing protein